MGNSLACEVLAGGLLTPGQSRDEPTRCSAQQGWLQAYSMGTMGGAQLSAEPRLTAVYFQLCLHYFQQADL